mmetsp:Transcript_25194/g.27499  ORF Transcript_25194/g.27499 Transcript_25194/m.27499 type:complete len:257 (+) Transcript_25194:24-794(+)
MLRASRSFKLVANRWKSVTTPVMRSTVRKFSNKTEEKVNSRGPVTYGSLAILFLGGVAAAVTYYIEKEEKIQKITNKVEVIGKPALGGEWVLVDQDGVPRSDASYHGKYTILYFGFTHCPDICPSELVKIGKILTQLESQGIKGQIQPIFISVDPSRDTLEQLRFYGQDFHKDFVYLTGTKDQVAKAARAYRVYFSKAIDVDLDSEEEYLVDHSIVLYLNSPTGEFLDFFTQRMTVDDVVAKIAKYIEADKAKQSK